MTDHEKALEAAARAVRDNMIYVVSAKEAKVFAQDAITAYLAQREADGFVMVPVEATSEQHLAGHGVAHHRCPLVTYSAMLAARPRGEG
jgi:hypothetical protein